MSKFFSISMITNKFILSVKRFPISILLLAGFAASLFMGFNDLLKDIPLKLLIFFSVGTIISVTATLWLEDFVNYLKQCIITAVFVLLWGVYCFFLPDGNGIQTSKIIEIIVIGAAAFLSMFFISFLKKDKDKAFWNFATQTIFYFCVAILFGIIVFAGLYWEDLALERLFNKMINESSLALFCFVLFVPLYFLANIPSKIAKQNEEISLNYFTKILALYILTPLAIICAVLLYADLFKVIFTWELPNGLISWLVSMLAGIGLLIIMLLYPARLEGKNRFIVFLSRYFGVMILPLLIFMTIGIFRRIGDYGITINRCYILLLNIWFYGIYAYLFITKSQRIKWILISPTVIFLFFSIGFWSIPNITKCVLTSELNKCLDNKKIDISDTTFFDKIEQKNKAKIETKLEYLYDTYGEKTVQLFFVDSVSHKLFISELGFTIAEVDDSEVHFSYYGRWDNDLQRVEKFNTFVSVTYSYYDENDQKNVHCSFDGNLLTIKIIADNQTFSAPLKEIALENLHENNGKNEKKIYQGNGYILLINELRGDYHKTENTVSVDRFAGYLFYNKR